MDKTSGTAKHWLTLPKQTEMSKETVFYLYYDKIVQLTEKHLRD